MYAVVLTECSKLLHGHPPDTCPGILSFIGTHIKLQLMKQSVFHCHSFTWWQLYNLNWELMFSDNKADKSEHHSMHPAAAASCNIYNLNQETIWRSQMQNTNVNRFTVCDCKQRYVLHDEVDYDPQQATLSILIFIIYTRDMLNSISFSHDYQCKITMI